MVATIEQLIGLMMRVHGILWSTAGWFLLYIVALFLLTIKKEKRLSYYLALAMLAVLIVIYNPFVMMKVRVFFPSAVEYTRIGWAALIIPIVGYAMTTTVSSNGLKGVHQSVLLLGAIMLVSLNTGAYYRVPENIYKVDSESLSVIEKMDMLRSEEGMLSVGVMFPVDSLMQGTMSCYDSIYAGITSYTSRYYLWPIYGTAPEDLSDVYSYILVEAGTDNKSIERLGYECIGQTEHIDIYYRTI